eukprot:379148-Alexandrium_andersonii.AAC.1
MRQAVVPSALDLPGVMVAPVTERGGSGVGRFPGEQKAARSRSKLGDMLVLRVWLAARKPPLSAGVSSGHRGPRSPL